MACTGDGCPWQYVLSDLTNRLQLLEAAFKEQVTFYHRQAHATTTIFVATKNVVCFVVVVDATDVFLSDKHIFVATKIVVVAATADDSRQAKCAVVEKDCGGEKKKERQKKKKNIVGSVEVQSKRTLAFSRKGHLGCCLFVFNLFA